MKTISRILAYTLVLITGYPVNADPLLSIRKTPFEQLTCSIDFAAVLGSDAFTVDSIKAENARTGADVSSTVIASLPAPQTIGTLIRFSVAGGVTGTTYLIRVKVIDSISGDKFEGQLTLAVTK